MRDEVHFGKSGLEKWSPTYSQLLALAERSAQQSIRTQRKTYSSVISRWREGRSVRAENNPEVDKGSAVEKKEQRQVPGEAVNPSSRIQWIIHRGGAQLHGPSARFSRPSLCQSALRGDGERGRTGMLKNTIKTLERLGLTRTFFFLNQLVCFPFQLRVNASRECMRRGSKIKTQMSELSGGSSSSPDAYHPTPGPARLSCQRAAGSPTLPRHMHTL